MLEGDHVALVQIEPGVERNLVAVDDSGFAGLRRELPGAAALPAGEQPRVGITGAGRWCDRGAEIELRDCGA